MRNSIKMLLVTGTILMFLGCSISNKKESLMKVGQKYSFQMKGQSTNPYFIVCKIDEEKGKKIVGVYFGGLKFKNPQSKTGYGESISHAPVEEEALIKSQIKLIAENVVLPEFKEGYETWKKEYDNGNAGYFNISPDKIVEYIVEAVNKK